jgi:hypothetical protein
MTTPLRLLLDEFRSSAQTEREMGNYFARLSVALIRNGHGMVQEYEDAWVYSEWALANNVRGRYGARPYNFPSLAASCGTSSSSRKPCDTRDFR